MIIRVISLLFLFTVQGYTQNIIQIKRPYAIVDAGMELGKIGDEVQVQRIVKGNVATIASAEIIRFGNDKTLIKVIEEYAGIRIRVGDLVQTMAGYDPALMNLMTQPPTTRIGFNIGQYLPYASLAKDYRNSLAMGGSLEIRYSKSSFIMIDYSYSKLTAKDSVDTYLSIVNLAMKYNLANKLFLEAGGGIYVPDKKIDEERLKESYYGFGVGPCVDLTSKDLVISVYFKYHAYKADDEWIRLFTAGARFSITP